MKSVRVNASGHILIYRPDYLNSYKTGNYKGYIYEHRFIMERSIGRFLTEDEVVHHLNLDPSDNRLQNLILLTRDAHAKLHDWLNSGAPGYESSRQKGVNSGKPVLRNTVARRCKVCEVTLSNHQTTYCCTDHHRIDLRSNSKIPSPVDLQQDLSTMSYLAVGRKYGVSDNAVRKWVRRFTTEGVWQS